MRGLDVSFSRVSAEWCRKRLSEGYRVFVQCLWTGGYQSKAGVVAVAEANLRAAREAGMITAGYLNTNPWYDAATSLAEAKFAAGTEWDQLGIVFNDVEIPGITEAQVKAHCEAITGAGKKTAIYSARWFWSGSLGNPQWPWLREYKIWNAYYDGDPDIDFNKAPWGPWTEADVIGEQYGGTDIEGVTIDWNVFDEAFFGGQEPQTEEEDWMAQLTDDEVKLLRDLLHFWGDPQPAISGWFDTGENPRKGYTMSKMASMALGYLDGQHIGTIIKKLDALKVGAVDVPALAKALAADAAFVKAIARAVNDDASARLKE